MGAPLEVMLHCCLVMEEHSQASGTKPHGRMGLSKLLRLEEGHDFDSLFPRAVQFFSGGVQVISRGRNNQPGLCWARAGRAFQTSCTVCTRRMSVCQQAAAAPQC